MASARKKGVDVLVLGRIPQHRSAVLEAGFRYDAGLFLEVDGRDHLDVSACQEKPGHAETEHDHGHE